MIINGWVTLGLFGAFGIGVFIAFMAFSSQVGDELRSLSHKANALSESNGYIASSLDRTNVSVDELFERVKELESPSIHKVQVENKLCPECGQEKEIMGDDYLCSDCRDAEPENIAA